MKDKLIRFYGKVLDAKVRRYTLPQVVGEGRVVQRQYLSISGSVETNDGENISIKGKLRNDKMRGFGPTYNRQPLQPDDIIVGEGWRRGRNFLLDDIELVWRDRQSGTLPNENGVEEYVDGRDYVDSGHGMKWRGGH